LASRPAHGARGGLVSSRGGAAALPDVGERTAFIAGQKVGRARRRRRGRRGSKVALGAGLVALGVAVLGLSAVTGHWLVTAPRFAVTDIEVEGVSRVTPERVRGVAAIEAGTNLWRIDPAAVVARVETLPEVRRAEVIRRLPNRLSILVEERRPFTLVHGSRLHWVDEGGQVLGESRGAMAPPAPVVSGLSEGELASMGGEPAPRVREALALIRVLLRNGSALASEISEIDMSRSDGPVLYTLDGVEVRLGTDEWEERLGRLERVLTQVGRDREGVRAIDLRFRDQVVLRKGGQG
jgi:cell division septal protein FtsQ